MTDVKELISNLHDDCAKQDLLLQLDKVLMKNLSLYDEKIALIRHIEHSQFLIGEFVFGLLKSSGNNDTKVVLPKTTSIFVDMFGQEIRKYDLVDTEGLSKEDTKNFSIFKTFVDRLFDDANQINSKILKLTAERHKFVEHTEILAKEHADKWFDYLVNECDFEK